MLIVCPSCASQYELDAAKLGPDGRKVRCAKCQTLWHVDAASEMPPAPSAEETQALLAEELERAAAIDAEISAVVSESETVSDTEAEAEAAPLPAEAGAEETPPVLSPERRRQAVRKPRIGKGRKAGRKGVVVPAAMALGGLVLLAAFVWQRQLVVRAAPQLAGLFERVGLPVNVRGLSLSAVESGLIDDGQGRFLVVEGDVTNIARNPTKVPLIQVAVQDEAGQILYRWTTEPPRSQLEPAELVRFRARLASPPEKGRSVQVRFVSAQAAAAGH